LAPRRREAVAPRCRADQDLAQGGGGGEPVARVRRRRFGRAGCGFPPVRRAVAAAGGAEAHSARPHHRPLRRPGMDQGAFVYRTA
jgi:hypothetical protein